jgi:DNA invertase Pin-like site-specific DNA recombinase
MNCILYARVSTDRQAEKDLSIPAQLGAMRAFAHQRNWLVSEEFVEPGASAKTAERPALQALLARVRDPKLQTDVVLVHKIDRLARNVYDHATIKALLTQRRIQLASVVENVDDSVPGQLVENIMASIAQFYSANLSEEVKKGMRQKVLRGGWPHLPPRGYVSVRDADGCGSHVEVHPRLGPLVSCAFELYATGHYGLRALALRLCDDGLASRSGRPIPISQVRRLLANPFYAGRVVWRGVDIRGAHPPLAAPELFERVQELLKSRRRDVGRQGSVRGFVLRGVATCAQCRGRMTAEQHGKWRYYRCSRQSYSRQRCSARFCRADVAHADLERVCNAVMLNRSVTEAIRQQTEQLIAGRGAQRESQADTLKQDLAKLGQREVALTEAFSAGTLSPTEYRRRVLALRERRRELERLTRQPPIPDEQLRARIKSILDVATSLWDLYQPLDDERRNRLLTLVFRLIVIGPEGILGYTLNRPFDELRKSPKDAARLVASLDA